MNFDVSRIAVATFCAVSLKGRNTRDNFGEMIQAFSSDVIFRHRQISQLFIGELTLVLL